MKDNDNLQIENSGEKMRLQAITAPLLTWYEKEKRDLPWRNKPDAYHVWVSEIMLQQTRVEAVKPYYRRFLEELSDIPALAAVDEKRLLKLWEGLGYYNRVRNMQKAAKLLVEQYGGKMPADYEKVLALPGIGSYTAGAICSIAFGICKPAVDGNVLRVISRVLAKDWDISKQSVKNELERRLEAQMPADMPGAYNQALMELGATVCVPNGMAHCEECPLSHICLALEQDCVMSLPVKAPKKPRRMEEKTVLVLQGQTTVALHRRPKGGLLPGLYEFPNLEGYRSSEQVLEYLKECHLEAVWIRPLPMAKHIFSHVEWHMKGYVIRLDETNGFGDTPWQFVNKQEIDRAYAIPSAFSAYVPFLV